MVRAPSLRSTETVGDVSASALIKLRKKQRRVVRGLAGKVKWNSQVQRRRAQHNKAVNQKQKVTAIKSTMSKIIL